LCNLAAATGTLSNTATVTIAGDPNAANNSATDTDTPTPQADLSITKTDGVTTATPGGSVVHHHCQQRRPEQRARRDSR
jgi:hypothetical protein